MTTRLPIRFLGLIQETLPPVPEPNVFGRPFWNAPGLYNIGTDGTVLGKYKNKGDPFEPVQVGDYGFACIGCEPGSGSQPFVVVSIDEKEQKVGLIFPYVTIVSGDDTTVTLQVNGDTYDKPVVSKEAATAETLYHVRYFSYDDLIGKYWISIMLGGFGNHGLPSHDALVTLEHVL